MLTRPSRRAALLAALLLALAVSVPAREAEEAFPRELTHFRPDKGNPVFTAAGEGHWDARIRERGWILHDGETFHLWYTGYDGTREGRKMLGYAASRDGLHWERHGENPIHDKHWVEDMMVVRQGDTFYMFAEGERDRAQLLTSRDGLDWHREGPLDVRKTDRTPIEDGPYGTPTAWYEDGVWHLFYERSDNGVWLATSKDLKVWTNRQDEPVLVPGPDEFDRDQIALNQIIKCDGRYYAYFHGASNDRMPRLWAPGIATSTDLVHWTKWSGNPLIPIEQNKSSGIVVPVGDGLRFYTMHDRVDAYLPAETP